MLRCLIVLDKIEGDSMKRENLAENLFQELRCNTSTSQGTIISVSHDRKYIEEVANKLYILTPEGLILKKV